MLPPGVLNPLIPLPIPDTFNIEYVSPIKNSTDVSDVESNDWHKELQNVPFKGIENSNGNNQMTESSTNSAIFKFGY